MPSIKSVDDIKSSLLRPSLTSHFYVEIPVPSEGCLLYTSDAADE